MSRWVCARTVLILAGLCLLASSPPAAACMMTVPNLSLWNGIHDAQLIVVGEIVDVEVNELAVAFDRASVGAMDLLYVLDVRVSLPTIEPLAALTIDVSTTLKGDPRSRVTFRLEGIATEDTTGLSYPAIFFLHREGRVWRWTRYPIAYGSPEELADLRRLIERAVAIGPIAREAEKLDWHVGAAVRATTRRHATWELGRHRELPEQALRRLAEGFVADPGAGHTFSDMLTLLASYPSPEVDCAALSGLLALPRGWMRDEARPLVEARLGESAGRSGYLRKGRATRGSCRGGR